MHIQQRKANLLKELVDRDYKLKVPYETQEIEPSVRLRKTKNFSIHMQNATLKIL